MISDKRIEILASDQPTAVWELRDLARQYLKLKAECDILQSKDAAIGYAYMKERAERAEADRDSWAQQADDRVKDWDDMRQRAERAEAKYEEEVQMWRNACELMNRAEAECNALRAESEWLRGLLREAQRYVPAGRYLSGEPLCVLNERIEAALAGEKPC